MIRIRILTKFETDIDEVNRLLEEGWEFEQIFRGINKEIYILHKYIQEEEEIREEKRKEKRKESIGKWERLVEEIEVLNDTNGDFYLKNSTRRYNNPYANNIPVALEKEDIKIILNRKEKELKDLEDKLENLIK